MSTNNHDQYNTIDIERWKRKEQYLFFSRLDNPNHSIVTELNCTKCFYDAQKSGNSFFASYLHKSLEAANEFEEFKLRIKESNILRMDTIHAAPTILRPDKSFGFALVQFDRIFTNFQKKFKAAKVRIENKEGLCLDETIHNLNVIYYSVVPWIHFSGITFAENHRNPNGIPQITFGKIREEHNSVLLPVGINVHHGLIDGYTLGSYIEKFQKVLNQ
jgi:chloramphenicol O-acetyltransferase type A